MKKAQEIDNIKRILAADKESRSIEEIELALDTPIDRRTLQRRLKELMDEGIVIASGKARATKYALLIDRATIHADISADAKTIIPLSRSAKQIQQYISRPPLARDPVGYNRNFLESYRPNVSNYLSKPEKQHLSTLGLTSQLNARAGTYAKQILQRLLIDLSWNSSRLEGNTYSLLDTQRLLDQGLLPDDKSPSEAQMILNHKDAIEFIVNNPEDIGFNRYTILNLHALLSNNLLPNAAASGSLRTHAVGIGGSVYTPPIVPQFIEDMFNLMLEKADKIENPFEQAFFIMVQLPYLQPFDDVNKRVSRLAANIPLAKKNLAPLSFTDVPNDIYVNGLLGVYEKNRVELLKEVFLWAYDRSAKQYAAQRQSLGEPDQFRLKYRDIIKALITEIIRDAHDKQSADILIGTRVLHLPAADQKRFIQTVENELVSLHEGNFARYFVSPSEFRKWQETWKS